MSRVTVWLWDPTTLETSAFLNGKSPLALGAVKWALWGDPLTFGTGEQAALAAHVLRVPPSSPRPLG